MEPEGSIKPRKRMLRETKGDFPSRTAEESDLEETGRETSPTPNPTPPDPRPPTLILPI